MLEHKGKDAADSWGAAVDRPSFASIGCICIFEQCHSIYLSTVNHYCSNKYLVHKVNYTVPNIFFIIIPPSLLLHSNNNSEQWNNMSLVFFSSGPMLGAHNTSSLWSWSWSWSYLPMKSNTASLNIRIYTFLQIPYSTTTTLTGARTWHYDHQRKQQHNKSSPLYTDVPVQTEQMHSITTISKGIMGSNQKWKSRLFRVVIVRHRKNQENHEKYISSPPYTDVPVQTKQMHSITTISKVIMCSNQKWKSRLFRVVIGQNRLAAADILKFSCNITNIAFRVMSLSEGCCSSVSSFQ